MHRFRTFIRTEFNQLTTVHKSDRPWQMPFAAALSSGLPLFIGALFNHLDFGLISSLGGLVFLYLPESPLYQRMAALMACAFGLTACYALGILSHFTWQAMIPVLTFIAILVTMVVRFYRLGPPGSLFFILAAAIGGYSPTAVGQIPVRVGLMFMGCLLATMIAFFYSLVMLRQRDPKPLVEHPDPEFDFVVVDAVIIGLAVGLSLVLAQVFGLVKAYWVPVSCLAVIQGMSLRAVWTKQLHRILGTTVGLFVAAGIFCLPLNPWTVACLMTVLAFVIETAVVRHYGFAAIFITPLTILLADAASLGAGYPLGLIEARFLDTVLGCLVGLCGGLCLHHKGFRRWLEAILRRLIRPEWFGYLN